METKIVSMLLVLVALTACNVEQTAGVINGTVSPEEAAASVAAEPSPTPSPTPLVCGTGMAPISATTCMDTIKRAPLEYTFAYRSCQVIGKRMCEDADYFAAVSVVNVDTSGWTMTATPYMDPTHGRMVIIRSHTDVSYDPIADRYEYAYHCCSM